jgi:hypothetical protein
VHGSHFGAQIGCERAPVHTLAADNLAQKLVKDSFGVCLRTEAETMYQTRGPGQAYSDAQGAPEVVEVEMSPDVRLVTEDPENFDLYEWALEFSKAVGFEVERVPLQTEE